MAVNEIVVGASPQIVWDVLADPQAYRAWVTGTKAIRGADDDFPRVGTSVYHRVGAGPLSLSDRTKVIRAEPPRLLLLDAGLGPLGSARVQIELTPVSDGTHVVLRESAGRGPNRLLQPMGDAALRGRNRWSLARLKEVVEARV